MRWTPKQLVTAAICIAVAFVLGFITLFHMPQGGSVTPGSMLPIILFSYLYGVKKGLIVAFIYSLLQFAQDPYFLTPVQFLLDYVFAYSLLGLAGIFKKNILPGVVLGGATKFICQFLSGIIFYAEYAPEGQPVWLYSLGYNGSVIAVDTAICVAIVLIPPMAKLIRRLKVKTDLELQKS